MFGQERERGYSDFFSLQYKEKLLSREGGMDEQSRDVVASKGDDLFDSVHYLLSLISTFLQDLFLF